MLEATVLLRNMIQKDPGKIVGPISEFIGFFLNHIYNIVVSLMGSDTYALGISIIVLTIFVRFLMLPLAVKSQKSMMAMQKLQPEMEKIKAKYGDSKDPETQQKMSAEIQQLYAKNKANPLSGCLPLFIQFPIFMAMYYIMNQPYKFIPALKNIYLNLADKVLAIPGYAENYVGLIYDITLPKIPKGMPDLSLLEREDLVRIFNKFVESDWNSFLSGIPGEFVGGVQSILDHKLMVEQLFSIRLTENTGLYWPAIIIPAVSVLTTFLSSYLSNKQSKSTDPNMVMQQRMMMIVMPIMMGVITIGIPGGVGLYWITSNIFQVIQQLILQGITKDKLNSEDPEKQPVKAVNQKKSKG
ncbi:YidC/Oxa1 family membrane protein insertase [Anaeropeptidivorans aminofermentans]|jgi:YidC/Oxa1 family membrane protein insertase|uniref:YidC/Oxa1 family membrane protein insertase n=1 Tax=Anaeropeptidivorans aminofermentans TaxID=2934315 RepID=UPI002B1F8DE9|nr:YidC/Oxa1 family membrane protein insertase [Anaeropeptidivorans aminofermentans]MBE6013032.1 YidC/Oxa1 family membrane protein insertase [Lachnospiraceae bacterium]